MVHKFRARLVASGDVRAERTRCWLVLTLRATARAEDVVARFGGDEFVLLLPRTSLDAARALVTRLASELPEQTYMWAGMPHALPRVSFGIAAFPEDGLLADQLIAKADERMYADKARAGGRLVDREQSSLDHLEREREVVAHDRVDDDVRVTAGGIDRAVNT